MQVLGRRRALWVGLLAACEQVERLAGARGSSPEGKDGGLLDWFGVPVKAADIPAHLARMGTLAQKASSPGSLPAFWQLC